tara:strand:+ start:20658 stop:20852 length:195 start_codon:yes stop_codon:yes gene_type:complete
MARLKIKDEFRGTQIKVSLIQTIVFSEYMTDDEYAFAVKKYPKRFIKFKAKKKAINLGGDDSDK